MMAYTEGEGGAAWIPGVLDDYALLIHACLDAWERTLELRYYHAAQMLAARMQRDFYDATGGGFFDTAADPDAMGVLSARRKPLQDTPTPAGNPTAAAALLRLEALNGDAICARWRRIRWRRSRAWWSTSGSTQDRMDWRWSGC